MKIAIIAHLKYPIAEPYSGGLETHTHLLATKLAQRGHDVTLFAAEGSDCRKLVPMGLPTGLLERDPVSAMTIGAVEHAAYGRIIEAASSGAFDMIHFNALHYLPLLHARDLNAPMVATLHTPPFLPLEAAMRSASAQATCVAVSVSLAAQWSGLASPPRVIANGIDLARFTFRAVPDAETFAFWFGRIVPEKGLHLAIDAAKSASIPLKFAGPVIDRAYWREEIAPRLTLDAQYVGHLVQTELAVLLGAAAVVLCTPRWEEPFGLVAVEALACGTPVAAFARGALPDIIDATCGALAIADEAESLASAAVACLGLERRACRARAEACFDAERMIDRYEALYRSVLALTPDVERGFGTADVA